MFVPCPPMFRRSVVVGIKSEGNGVDNKKAEPSSIYSAAQCTKTAEDKIGAETLKLCFRELCSCHRPSITHIGIKLE